MRQDATWSERLSPLKTRSDEPPHYQDYDRANDSADETSAFAGLIPPDGLAKVCCYKGANDPQQRCQNKTLGLVLVAGMKESRDHPATNPIMMVQRTLIASSAGVAR